MPAGAATRYTEVLRFGEVNPLPGWKPHLKDRADKYVRAVFATNTPLPLAEDPADILWRLVLGRSPIRLRCVDGQPRARNR